MFIKLKKITNKSTMSTPTLSKKEGWSEIGKNSLLICLYFDLSRKCSPGDSNKGCDDIFHYKTEKS